MFTKHHSGRAAHLAHWGFFMLPPLAALAVVLGLIGGWRQQPARAAYPPPWPATGSNHPLASNDTAAFAPDPAALTRTNAAPPHPPAGAPAAAPHDPAAPHRPTSEQLIFNFENSTEGWAPSTYTNELSIATVYPTTTQHISGSYSLALVTQFSPVLTQGAVSVMFPGNLAGHTISAWVWCPIGASGSPTTPNGIQLFVKDQNFVSQYAAWTNITTSMEGTWTQVTMTVTGTAGFDPTRITDVGLKLGMGPASPPFQSIFYLDDVRVSRESLSGQPADYSFDFNTLTPQQQRDKPFGHGPYWDEDPGRGANAWHANDITARNGALAITTTFVVTTSQKGYVEIVHRPPMDINNKSNRIIRAEVKFDPYVGPEDIVASVWLYDIQDSARGATPNRWYKSKDVRVGGSVWNELSFDLIDSTEFDTDTSLYIQHNEIVTDSLKNIFKVGFQFWGNKSYTGTITLDNVTVGGREIISNFHNLNQSFITRRGADLVLYPPGTPGAPTPLPTLVRLVGTNVYYLFMKPHYMIDDVMATLQRNGIKVLRTWGFADGKAPYAEDGDNYTPNGNEGGAFQPEPGLYYTPTFDNFDYVIRSAGAHGIRLIIPLVNHWSDKDAMENGIGVNNFGGMSQYLEWCGLAVTPTPSGRITNKTLFYSNTSSPLCPQGTRGLFERYIDYMLNRQNKLTGLRYKDDPTIMAWELANEPRCQEEEDDCPDGPAKDTIYNWATIMSTHIDTQTVQLVAMGDEGLVNRTPTPPPGGTPTSTPDIYYNGDFGVDWHRNLGIPAIDFGTIHLYPDTWERSFAWSQNWITDHITSTKPVVFEEFGIYAPPTPYVCPPPPPSASPSLTPLTPAPTATPSATATATATPLTPFPTPFNRNAVYLKWTEQFATGGEVDSDLVWMLAGRVNNANECYVPIPFPTGTPYYPDYDGFTFWEPISTTQLIKDHACQLNQLFLDVPPVQTFYPYIQWLACRNYISGYTCGGPGEPCPGTYFRPGNTVTRGQLAKMVAGGFGFADPIPTTQQTFTDVPPNNPFWVWIERLAMRGIISGYPCGGPGEPCDPQNRPYFRPYANVTRGQLSKLISVAAGWNGPIPTTQQTFADVPPPNPFWLWIEELAGRGAISGYMCGGPGEPCDPQNRPYFRWGTNATRGQISKILYKALTLLLYGR